MTPVERHIGRVRAALGVAQWCLTVMETRRDVSPEGVREMNMHLRRAVEHGEAMERIVQGGPPLDY